MSVSMCLRTNGLRLALVAVAVAALFGTAGVAPVRADDAATPPPAAAAPPPSPDTVVARLNGVDITEADVQLAAQEYSDSLQQIPPDQVMAALINGIIDIKLMARAAEAAGVQDDPDSQRVINFARDRALRGEFLRTKVFAGIDDAAIQKRYAEETAKFVPGDEIHAAHILVQTEDEAKAIIAQLDAGGDFAAIAKEKSIDTGSGANGGDLGFFGKGAMVQPFEEAAFALDVGTYSKVPVKTDFGYHIIKVIEKRKENPPTLDQVRSQIVDTLRKEAFFAEVDKLRKAATVEILTPPPAPDAANGGAATPPPADATTPPDAGAGDAATPPAQ